MICRQWPPGMIKNPLLFLESSALFFCLQALSLSACLTVTALTMTLTMAFAHEGHDSFFEEQTSSGSIELSDVAISNLGIETAFAERRNIPETLRLFGRVIPDPRFSHRINARFSGQVVELFALAGDGVRAGERVLTVIPLQVGSSEVGLISPISGRVTLHNAAKGQSFTPEMTLVEVVNTDKVLVEGLIYNLRQLKKVKIGQKILAKPIGFVGKSFREIKYEGKTFEGKIVRKKETLDLNEEALRVYAEFDNVDNSMVLNSRVSLELVVNEFINRLSIPRVAVLGDGGNHFIFVKTNNQFLRRPVQLGVGSGSLVEILSGVNEDEEVIINGHYQLQWASSSPNLDHNHQHD